MIQRLLRLTALSLLGLLLALSVADTFPRQWPLPEPAGLSAPGSLGSTLIRGWNLESLRGIAAALALSSLPIALSCWLISRWGFRGEQTRLVPSLFTPLAALGGALLTIAGLALMLPQREPSLGLLLLLLFSPSLTLLFSLRSLILLTTSRSRRREAQREREREQP